MKIGSTTHNVASIAKAFGPMDLATGRSSAEILTTKTDGFHIDVDKLKGWTVMNFGTLISPHHDVPPGRILVRNSSDPKTTYIAFTTAAVSNESEKLSIFIGPGTINGVIYTSAVSDPAWDVTDFVEIRPDFSSGEFKDTSHLAHGNLFLTQTGEFGVFGGSGGQRERLFINARSGVLIRPHGEVVVFEKWRLAVVDGNGNEIGCFDPEVICTP